MSKCSTFVTVFSQWLQPRYREGQKVLVHFLQIFILTSQKLRIYLNSSSEITSSMSTTFDSDGGWTGNYDIEMNDLSQSHYDNARKYDISGRTWIYCYCLAMIAGLAPAGLLIWGGYETLQNSKTYVYPAIETECIVTHRGSDKCKPPGETEKNKGVMYVNCIPHCVSVSRVTNIYTFSNKLQCLSFSDEI